MLCVQWLLSSAHCENKRSFPPHLCLPSADDECFFLEMFKHFAQVLHIMILVSFVQLIYSQSRMFRWFVTERTGYQVWLDALTCRQPIMCFAVMEHVKLCVLLYAYLMIWILSVASYWRQAYVKCSTIGSRYVLFVWVSLKLPIFSILVKMANFCVKVLRASKTNHKTFWLVVV